jgi:HAD superfamily hydrolase (TIGR01509 family)
MIKAVIFDCFGVLTSEGWLAFKAAQFGHNATLQQQAADLNKQADAGLISHEEFVRSVAELADIPEAEVYAAIDVNAPNEKLFAYIAEELKPKYKIGLLSNAAANWLEELFSNRQIALFDAISLSYEAGLLKPHPGAYEKIAEQLDIEAEEGIFVDDQERHCTGARDAGMRAILYKDFEQMKSELEKMLAANTKG